jgi:UDP-GlcNAc:undecaprenyl-phosphate GlcNAc-1-phosphate transferase
MLETSVTVVTALVCALTAMLLCILLGLKAHHFGWLDHPGERKVHQVATPLVGGVAIFLTLLWPFLYSGNLAFCAALTLALACGLADDLRPLRPVTRFIWQGCACLVMVYFGGVVLSDFGRLMWDGVLELGMLSVPITVFAALGVINAFNMIDGLDGLAGTVFLVCTGSLAWLAAGGGHPAQAQLLLLAFAAVTGFLVLNARFPWNARARVFLGDAGSTFLGMFLAWMFVDLGNGDDRAFEPMTAVWIFGLPLLDTTRLMATRWRSGKSTMAADQQHLHHAFLRAGFSVRQAWLAVSALAAGSALAGLAFEKSGLPTYIGFYTYVVLGVIYLRWMRSAWQVRRFLGRTFSDP